MTPLFAIITGPEIAVLVGLAILLFGADRIPKLARSMGEAKKEFESAQRGDTRSTGPSSPGAPTSSQTIPTSSEPAGQQPPPPPAAP